MYGCVRLWLCIALSSVMKPYKYMYGYVRLCTVRCGNVWLLMTIGRLRHIIFDCVRLFITAFAYVGLCRAAYGYVWLYTPLYLKIIFWLYISGLVAKCDFVSLRAKIKCIRKRLQVKKYSFFNVWSCTAMKVRGLCRDVAKRDKTDTNTNVLWYADRH